MKFPGQTCGLPLGGTLARHCGLAVSQHFRTLALAWNAFWFTPMDAAPLGALRLLAGGMLFYSHLVWGLQLESFLGPEGWNSAELIQYVQRDTWAFSFWWQVPPTWYRTIHVSCLIVLFLFWIGCGTRVTSILAFLIHASYCNRAQLSGYGLDQITAILAMYLMIGPSGANYSFDSVWRRWRGARATLAAGETSFPSESTISPSAGLALRLIQIHYCIIYFFAGTAKLQGRTWWTGEALWRAFANYEYQSTDMTWLAAHPWVLQLLTMGTVLWEISFAYLVWQRRWRPWMLAAGLAMHLGIGACMGMWTFGLMMMFGYVAFVPPATVRRVMNRLLECWSGSAPMTIVIDRSPAALRRAAWWKAWDGGNRLGIQFQMDDVSLSNNSDFTVPDRSSQTPSMPVPHSAEPRVLCILRQDALWAATSRYLSAHHFQAFRAGSFAEAADILAQHSMDAVVCDGTVGDSDEILEFHHALITYADATSTCYLLKKSLSHSLGPALRGPTTTILEAPVSLRDIGADLSARLRPTT